MKEEMIVNCKDNIDIQKQLGTKQDPNFVQTASHVCMNEFSDFEKELILAGINKSKLENELVLTDDSDRRRKHAVAAEHTKKLQDLDVFTKYKISVTRALIPTKIDLSLINSKLIMSYDLLAYLWKDTNVTISNEGISNTFMISSVIEFAEWYKIDALAEIFPLNEDDLKDYSELLGLKKQKKGQIVERIRTDYKNEDDITTLRNVCLFREEGCLDMISICVMKDNLAFRTALMLIQPMLSPYYNKLMKNLYLKLNDYLQGYILSAKFFECSISGITKDDYNVLYKKQSKITGSQVSDNENIWFQIEGNLIDICSFVQNIKKDKKMRDFKRIQSGQIPERIDPDGQQKHTVTNMEFKNRLKNITQLLKFNTNDSIENVTNESELLESIMKD